MAVFKKSSGVCHGRGFSSSDATGYCAKFFNWVCKPTAVQTAYAATTNYATNPTVITATGSNFVSGTPVRFFTDGSYGTLPPEITEGQIYYAIADGVNTFKIASSVINAYLGTAITLSSDLTDVCYVFSCGPTIQATKTDYSSGPEHYTITTSTNHGYSDKDPVVFVPGTSGALPSGVSAGVIYFVKSTGLTTFKLCISPWNVDAGIYMDLLGNITPTIYVYKSAETPVDSLSTNYGVDISKISVANSFANGDPVVFTGVTDKLSTIYGLAPDSFFINQVAPHNMTSNILPSPYVASASTETGGNLAYFAFDGNASNSWYAAFSNPTWLKLDYGAGNGKKINRYEFVLRDIASRAPKDWLFQGSNDDSIWTTLDTQVGQTGFVAWNWYSYKFTNTTAYRYYRIYITANNGDSYVQILELYMYEAMGKQWALGDRIRLSVSDGGSLPSALSLNTDYWIGISQSGNTSDTAHIKLATSLANALAGTWIGTFSSAGTAPFFINSLTRNVLPNTEYFASACTGTDFKLCPSKAQAIQNISWIDLGSDIVGSAYVFRPAVNKTAATNNYTQYNVTATGSNYQTGDAIKFAITGDATLPAGLTAGVEYYAIRYSANVFKVASTQGNSTLGIPIDLQGDINPGTGTATVQAVNGGPGWKVLWDRSAGLSKSFLPAAVDINNDIITIPSHGFVTGDFVIYTTTGTVIGNLASLSGYYVIKVDADHIRLAYNATYLSDSYDNSWRDLTSRGTGTHTLALNGPYVVVGNKIPVMNEPAIVIKLTYTYTAAAYVIIQYYLGFNNDEKVPLFGWSGHGIETYDSADFVYDFRGGDEQMWLNSRRGTTWEFSGVDTWLADTNLLEGSNWDSVLGTLSATVSTGTNKTLYLQSNSEALKFTVGNYYYIHDFSYNLALNRHGHWVNYVQCTGIPGNGTPGGSNQIIVNRIDYSGFAAMTGFPIGAKIGSYTHRFYSIGNYNPNVERTQNTSSYASSSPQIPYYSHKTNNVYVCDDQRSLIEGGCSVTYNTGYIETMNPNDLGLYTAQRPGIYESVVANSPGYYGYNTDMNRGYGTLKNLYVTPAGSMMQMADGKIINSKNWLYFITTYNFLSGDGYNHATMFLDTESDS